MIHRWEFSDGTVVRWTSSGSLLVEGNSKLARGIKWRTEHPCQLGRVLVIPPPGGLVDVDLLSIWLVDAFLREDAMFYRVDLVSSTYTPKDEDMPPDVYNLVMRARAWPNKPLPPGAVY